MLRNLIIAALLLAPVIGAAVPPAESAPTPPEAPAAPAPPAVPAQTEQQQFDQFRRDLVNLLALRGEPEMLVAAAELAYPDTADKARPSALKSPALLKRAQKRGPDDALVWWITTFIGCGNDTSACPAEATATLQQVAADNAAAWLPSLHATKDAAQARAMLASMAQAKRFDDYWNAGVLAVYRGLQILPVPAEVLGHGLNATAARINLATSVGGGFLPNYARLGEMCAPADPPDEALVADCLAVARLLEAGGTFRSQSVGFALEDRLLPAGTARDVLRARQRASQWQKKQFLELSARFGRDEALAESYVELLGQQPSELTTVTALLRNQRIATDPPPGWQPSDDDVLVRPGDPLAPPVH
jgi:hypothetical protein